MEAKASFFLSWRRRTSIFFTILFQYALFKSAYVSPLRALATLDRRKFARSPAGLRARERSEARTMRWSRRNEKRGGASATNEEHEPRRAER